MVSRTASKITRTPQKERTDSTQKKILDSAKKLLIEEGHSKATLSAIARGANVSLGALQHHFENRDALMERLVEEVMAPLKPENGIWPDTTLPIEERTEKFVMRAWDEIFGAKDYIAAWVLFFGCRSTPKIFKRIDSMREREDEIFFRKFIEIFPEIKNSHPNPRAFAAVVFSSLRGLGIFNIFTTPKKDKEEQLLVIADSIVRASK